jgi:glycosyltransferase involved in cell wall biosynthesis
VTSEQDKRALDDLRRSINPSDISPNVSEIEVVRNGVDLSYFVEHCGPRDPHTIVLTGKMSYHANVTAALYLINEIMPRVWEQIPDAQVQIVGQKPRREILDLRQRYPSRIHVTGSVPDLRPYLAQATVAVAPILYGAGIQNKVLEAMAMGTPVVATSKAVSALSACQNENVLLADDPQAFAHQVVRLLRDPGLATQIGQNGRHYVESNHDWNHVAKQLQAIYQAVIASTNRMSESVDLAK